MHSIYLQTEVASFYWTLSFQLGFTRVLSVGTPRLHEMIQSKASQEEDFRVRSLLLDIDFRYSQFYTEDEFCHYNMFNHYFLVERLHMKLVGNSYIKRKMKSNYGDSKKYGDAHVLGISILL